MDKLQNLCKNIGNITKRICGILKRTYFLGWKNNCKE